MWVLGQFLAKNSIPCTFFYRKTNFTIHEGICHFDVTKTKHLRPWCIFYLVPMFYELNIDTKINSRGSFWKSWGCVNHKTLFVGNVTKCSIWRVLLQFPQRCCWSTSVKKNKQTVHPASFQPVLFCRGAEDLIQRSQVHMHCLALFPTNMQRTSCCDVIMTCALT